MLFKICLIGWLVVLLLCVSNRLGWLEGTDIQAVVFNTAGFQLDNRY
jgi:hypothetical protein